MRCSAAARSFQFATILRPCQQCEMACTVAVTAVDRPGTSPCIFTCPAGIKAHGYVSLTHSARYEKAFNLILETTPQMGRALVCDSEVQGTPAEIPAVSLVPAPDANEEFSCGGCQRLDCHGCPFAPQARVVIRKTGRRSRTDGPVRSTNDREAGNRLAR